MVEHICKECGITFYTKHNLKNPPKFCSKKCYQTDRLKNATIIKVCPICGKEFSILKCQKRRQYCSVECARKAKITRVVKICAHCGTKFTVIKQRENTAKYCCKACADNALKGIPNVLCDVCGKPIHRKPSHVTKNKHGNFCSKTCVNKWKMIAYSGEGNHQFGLKGHLNASFKGEEIPEKNNNLVDILVYVPNHPFANSRGRVKKHRLIVEENYQLFDIEYFVLIENKYYLRPDIVVHHLNENHNDNRIENLVPCTTAEHALYHNLTKMAKNKREEIIKNITAVLKQGELLGSPEVDNQQPSQSLITLEGSETND